MQRITVTLDDALVEELDRAVASGGGGNRSEALRDIMRAGLNARVEDTSGECVGVLTYVYAHRQRALARRLTEKHHDDHDLTVCSTHLHLDHDSCLEVAILRGDAEPVRRFCQTVIAERGVRHGALSLVPVETQREEHNHGGRQHRHTHLKVRETGG